VWISGICGDRRRRRHSPEKTGVRSASRRIVRAAAFSCVECGRCTSMVGIQHRQGAHPPKEIGFLGLRGYLKELAAA